MLNELRIFIFAGILLFVSITMDAQRTFIIKGKLTDTSRNGLKITLSYRNGGKPVYVAALVKDGMYEFKGTIMEPAKAGLSMSLPKSELSFTNMSDKAEFYLEGDTIFLQGFRLVSSTIKSGTRSQQDFISLKAILKPFDERQKSVYQKMLDSIIARDTISRNAFSILNEQCKLAIDSVERAFISTHPGSFVSLGLLEERADNKGLANERENITKLYNGLSQSIQQSIAGKKIGGYIRTAHKLQAGNPAMDFTMNDTLGKPVSLSSFRGQYLLLDFWASWCIPCRHENAKVKKAYDRFKDKNFNVLSVSLEKAGDRKAWVEAILKDGLTWPQVATLTEEEKSNISNLYGIQSIPMNFLIDPKGNIVAVHLRGDALIKKLEEIL